MDDRADNVWRGFAQEGPRIYWANIFVSVACLFNYFFSYRPWEIETLAVLIFLSNGFALWNRNHELNVAYRREAEDIVESAQSEAAGTEGLKSPGVL